MLQKNYHRELLIFKKQSNTEDITVFCEPYRISKCDALVYELV